jgi:hypothetical protein
MRDPIKRAQAHGTKAPQYLVIASLMVEQREKRSGTPKADLAND